MFGQPESRLNSVAVTAPAAETANCSIADRAFSKMGLLDGGALRLASRSIPRSDAAVAALAFAVHIVAWGESPRDLFVGGGGMQTFVKVVGTGTTRHFSSEKLLLPLRLAACSRCWLLYRCYLSR